jgi:hypothetical protein
MNNPLTDIAPGKWRRIGYFVLTVVGVSIAGTMAGYGAIDAEVPRWLTFTAAFYGTVTGPIWAVPASNVSKFDR